MEHFGNKHYPATQSEWCNLPVQISDNSLYIGGWQVMQVWEQPIMKIMAQAVTRQHGDVLEIGFGLGIAASEIILQGCRSYTVIEAHPVIAASAREWAKTQSTQITVIEDFWQNAIQNLFQEFDGILFDTYPVSVEERGKNHFTFIPHAPKLLRNRGVLTHYSDETIYFREEHLHLLLTHFEIVEFIKVFNLNPPEDCEYWNESHMVIPIATKLK